MNQVYKNVEKYDSYLNDGDLYKIVGLPPFFLYLQSIISYKASSLIKICGSFKSTSGEFYISSPQYLYDRTKIPDTRPNSPSMLYLISNFIKPSIYCGVLKPILTELYINKEIYNYMQNNKTVYYRIKNPIYLECIEQRSLTTELVDSEFKHIYPTLGNHTVVELTTDNSNKKMFNIILDSSDKNSKKTFPNNSSNSFSIKLPFHIMKSNTLNRWYVGVSSVSTPRIKNPLAQNLIIYYKDRIGTTWSELKLPDIDIISTLQLSNLISEQSRKFILNQALSLGFNPPIFTSTKGKLVIKTCDFDIKLTGVQAYLLGFVYSLSNQEFVIDNSSAIKSKRKVDINFYQPTSFIITSDIVKHSSFAQKNPQILKFSEYNINQNNDFFIQYNNIDLTPLEYDNFENINITFLDTRGNKIEFVDKGKVIIQLRFVKK